MRENFRICPEKIKKSRPKEKEFEMGNDFYAEKLRYQAQNNVILRWEAEKEYFKVEK